MRTLFCPSKNSSAAGLQHEIYGCHYGGHPHHRTLLLRALETRSDTARQSQHAEQHAISHSGHHIPVLCLRQSCDLLPQDDEAHCVRRSAAAARKGCQGNIIWRSRSTPSEQSFDLPLHTCECQAVALLAVAVACCSLIGEVTYNLRSEGNFMQDLWQQSDGLLPSWADFLAITMHSQKLIEHKTSSSSAESRSLHS